MDIQTARERIADIDRQMAKLFAERMETVEAVAQYKQVHQLPIFDPEQEKRVMERNLAILPKTHLQPYYVSFLQATMESAKAYQQDILGEEGWQVCGDAMILRLPLRQGDCEVILQTGGIDTLSAYFALERKVLIVTDSGVPSEYAERVAACCKEAVIVTVPQGEESKSLTVYQMLMEKMLRHQFTRKDCVVAVGGGMISDLAGFAAATFMRGIAFYTVPTTVLAQVDASVGGKTALNLSGIKNPVGAFYQPKQVLIDPSLLKTLSPRQRNSGLAEALKMGVIADAELVALFETGEIEQRMEQIIQRSIFAKQRLVMQDEREQNLRRLLNFGHTLGHGVESVTGLYHGECVAMGMLPMCSEAVRERLLPILQNLQLPVSCMGDKDAMFTAILHDKKAEAGKIVTVQVDTMGEAYLKSMEPMELRERLGRIVQEEQA